MAKTDWVTPDSVLSVGQRLEISLASDAEENFYTSRIEDFNKDFLIVAMPMEKGYPIIPATSEIVYCRLRTNEGVYKFTSVYVSKEASPIPVLKLVLPNELEKHQQREFVRVDTMLELKVFLEDKEKNLIQPPYKTFTKDISGGGLRFVMSRHIPEGCRVYIETEELTNIGALKMYCEVVRSLKPIETKEIYWVGVKFVDLSKQMERDLIRFIFQRQRDLLAKRSSR